MATWSPGETAASPLTAHWNQLAPPARGEAAVIFDPIRDRLLVLGGFTGSGVSGEVDVWSLSSAEGASWQPLHPAGVPPLSSPWKAVYDPVRDRVLVMEDYGKPRVWALALSPQLAWEQLLPLGVAPGVRDGCTLAYDPMGDRLLLFGGAVFVQATPYNTTRYLDELWSLSLGAPPTWSRLNPMGPGPTPRGGAVMTVDEAGGRALLFGGIDSTHRTRDTWSLDLRGALAWSLVDSSASAPLGRWGHSMIVDPHLQRLVLFGGIIDGVESLPELWQLPLVGTQGWRRMEVPGGPGEQAILQAAVFDPIRSRMVVYGGEELSNNVWSLRLADSPVWSRVSVPEDPPPIRTGQTATYVDRHDRVVLFGGSTGKGFLNDLWAARIGATLFWTPLAAQGSPPPPRAYHTAVYDSLADRILIYGGEDPTGTLDDAWSLSFATDPPSWTEILPIGQRPRGRSGHSAVFDAPSQSMVVFGGESGYRELGDLWQLSLAGVPRWDSLTVSGMTPSARTLHASILDHARRMWLFGGKTDGLAQNDLWQLNLNGPRQWQRVVAPGTRPEGRYAHGAVFDPGMNSLVFAGGTMMSSGVGSPSHQDLVLSLEPSPEWHPIVSTSFPGGFDCRALVRDPNSGRVILVGAGGVSMNNSEWALDLDRGDAPLPPDVSAGSLKLDPNPMTSTLRIEFELDAPGPGQLAIFDLSGRLVRVVVGGLFRGGRYAAWWDARDAAGRRVAPGIYFCGFISSSARLVRRVALLH